MVNDFHEIRFPLDVSLGRRGGPSRRTDIVTLASGREHRNARFAHWRRRYDAGLGVRTVWLGRVARVQAAATKMVLAGDGKHAAAVKADLEARAEKALSTAGTAKVNAAIAASGSASAAGAPLAIPGAPEQAANPTVFLILVAVVASAFLVAFLIHRARAQRELASAFAEAASETE